MGSQGVGWESLGAPVGGWGLGDGVGGQVTTPPTSPPTPGNLAVRLGRLTLRAGDPTPYLTYGPSDALCLSMVIQGYVLSWLCL